MTQRLATLEDVADKPFDFVIIGGGTAGCVLAARLSEDPSVSVALIEAAPAHLGDSIIPDPMGWMKQVINPEYDWMYWTVEQPRVREKDPFLFPRGRSLGGTSCMNFMIWNHPERSTVNGFEELGNPGWNWTKFHHYLKKVERFVPVKKNFTPGFDDLYSRDAVGHDGNLPISFIPTGNGLEPLWQQALTRNGVALRDDSMSGQINGTWKSFASIDAATGQRSSSFEAYLAPVLNRSNLKVLTDASVHRIETKDEVDGVTADAVIFEHGGSVHRVFVGKEVIVSAGCVKSPQILELSGIGDSKILGPLGIPVRVDLPGVGTNVQEHTTVGLGMYKLNETGRLVVTSDMLKDPDFQSTLLRHHPNLDIPWKLHMNALSFVPIQAASKKADQIIAKQRAQFEANKDQYPPGLKEQYEIQLKNLADKNEIEFEAYLFPFAFPDSFPEPTKPYMNIIPQLVHPWSRGTIHIGSSDPKAPPVIDPRYLEQEIDLELLVEAVRFVRQVADTEPLKEVIAEEVVPGRQAVRSESDEELTAFVKKALWSSWHTSSSCSMLPRDKNGVVDPNLNVYGTANIRVCDLSVVPLIPGAHTQSTVYAFAEIGADLIKAKYGLRSE